MNIRASQLEPALAWLFNGYAGREPFPQRPRKACEPGYTEPDPRADLGGTDVARKLVILAREAGLALSLGDVSVQSFVPHALAHLDRENFMPHLDILDAPLAARHAASAARGAGPEVTAAGVFTDLLRVAAGARA